MKNFDNNGEEIKASVPAAGEENDKLAKLNTKDLEKELERVRYFTVFKRALRNTIFTLITVAAIAVLVAVLLLPVLRIYGTSMTPSLTEGNIVLSIKSSSTAKRGDIVAFYYNNKILVKRVIAFSGEWVDIDSTGNVYVDNRKLDEPYVAEPDYGISTDIKLPYQVPESRVFVMGDHRKTSTDSRSTAIGCVSEEQIVGRIVFRVWPLKEFGVVH